MTNNNPNQLINEKSPYLLQHAYNPVNWYPWCDEAFEKAKKEDKPIFLSIGYSTCHWCHVMAHESFEDEEVAKLLNRDYICIKVDKEERPDVDAVYMTVCQALTGSGGWPLTIVMTPEQKPFFAGTYFPKQQRYQMMGLFEILTELTKHWKERRDSVEESASKIVKALKDESNSAPTFHRGFNVIHKTDEKKIKEIFQRGKTTFAQNFDEKYGGFGHSPKFPTPHNLMFLLRYHHYEKDETALYMVQKTLKQMYLGGIFDHIGYGFARYSTDDQWLVPHFEKMLYDNALLVIAYLEAYQVYKIDLYRQIAEKVLRYVMREMTSADGGFYSAQDADSEGVEGKYYVFSPGEMRKVLGEAEGNQFNHFFDIREKPNFEEGNIPNLIQNPIFEDDNISFDSKMEENIQKIYRYRLKRTYLHKDDKILTSWNALMLVAFTKAYGVLGKDEYLKTAQACQEFLEKELIGQEEDKLLIRYREGHAAGRGTLEEYAFYIWALTSFYEVTFDTNYLDRAIKLCHSMIDLFWDDKAGGFFLTAKDAEDLIYRPKETYDGAIPSGNSVAAYVLVKLKKMTGSTVIQEICDRQLSFIKQKIEGYPSGYSFAMMALMMDTYPEGFLCENGVCS
ncbi:thioredoxin domain-containing protein [Sinanaerobacter sp. ZZT-01]|uniref:thioredoxin domain-containing protein n=1 Tax=Sinanaerobacter sp. ZZT-01 TaxID=3111540 RepID=UPI002D76CCEB|nr:thioredoxin domain-containing protein [Sinanaerobacter sp. ZZT-01]WRR92447.1 thioredoxin domain-containing protein [Sinanaerobacter sp. ZZT-01]